MTMKLSPAEASILDQLIAIRREKGIGLPEVAERCFVGFRSIYNLERGYSSPTLARLINYANAIGAQITITQAET